jgi:hypothetical protein
VGGLWLRLKPARDNLAHTALRLCPSRVAICAALWPLAQSSLRSATLTASHMHISIHPKVRRLQSVLRGSQLTDKVSTIALSVRELTPFEELPYQLAGRLRFAYFLIGP